MKMAGEQANGDENLPLGCGARERRGVTAVSFLKEGSPDPEITATNLLANAYGKELRATVVIAPIAALGSGVSRALAAPRMPGTLGICRGPSDTLRWPRSWPPNV